jgi:hypothetical protein
MARTGPRAGVRVAGLVLFLLALSCAEQKSPSPDTAGRHTISYDPTRPWVVTAVNYHFHDAHPTPRLNPETALVFKNATQTLHNVSFQGLDFDMDLPAGAEFSIDPMSSLFPRPGHYLFVCSYHADRGMGGRVVVGSPPG